MLQDSESEADFSMGAFQQLIMYSELRNVHPNYALWIVTTHVLKTLNNYAAEKFATQVRKIFKTLPDTYNS